MNFEEIKAFLNENKDNEDVKILLKEMIDEKILNDILETDTAKRLLQPKMDRYFAKGLETWKQNNLNKIVEEEIAKRFPPETPEQKQIRELQQKLQEMEMATKREKLQALKLKALSEQGLPAKLSDFINVDNEELLPEVINTLKEVWTTSIESVINERLKGQTPHTPQQVNSGKQLTKEDIAKMPVKERMKIYNENPELWRKIMNS